MEKISVAVRFRPSSVPEAAADRHWKVEENRISFHRPLGTPVSGLAFAFDHVFDQETTNEGVYGLLIKSIIDAAVQGFNGTAFAYGQTSSGKTFTMNGSDTEPGITQLAVRDVFHCIQSIREREFLIRVSYMEIYNEEINDLLSLGNEKLPIHESLERGIFVAGLREEIVNSEEQVLKLIKLGEANRRFGETNMNVRSSRSHTIFRMVIESSLKQSVSLGDVANADAIRVSVLNLVDLAGSERIAKTGAGGVRLKEGKYINKSLMTLGNVINKLSENGKQRAHIPYRDSKLTRILQLSLGGNAKTSIICTVAPEEVHMEETRGTLQFASRAKRVTNCAQVNEILTDAALLKRQKLEIEELRRKLQEGSNSEVLEQVILKQRNDMLKSEYEREKLAMELEEEKRSREALEQRVREQQMTIDELSAGYRVSDQDITSTGNLDHHDNFQEDGFQTPNFKSLPTDFVSKRSTYSVQNDSSPIPEILANVVDEEQWLQLNEGHTTDIDLLQMTPTKPQISQPPETYVEPAVVDGPATEEGCKCPISECVTKNELLEAAKQKCTTIEKECNLLNEENASLSKALSMSAETVELLTNEKEQMLNDLTIERQKMKDLKEEIRMFGLAFAQRENSLTSLYAKSKAMVENLKTCHVPKN